MTRANRVTNDGHGCIARPGSGHSEFSVRTRDGDRRGSSRLRGTLLFAAVFLAVSGCSERISLRLDPRIERPDRSVVIFFVDGMDLTRMEQMAADGQLPNIRRVFMEGGTQVKNTVVSMPSVTYPNCTSLITGVHPGHHGIVGNFWFDRSTLTTRYYMQFETYLTVNEHFTSPTLYDLLHDELTVNVQDHTRRGVKHTIDNRMMFGYSWFIGDYINADRYAGMQFREVSGIANRAGRWPAVTMTYYPATDEMGHRYGADSPEYKRALLNIDAVVYRITEAIHNAGLGNSTYFVLVADHSHVPIAPGRQFDLGGWLKDARHLRVLGKPLRGREYNDRLERLDGYDVVGTADEDRVAMLHLRGSRGWGERPDTREVEAWVTQAPSLLDVPAVQFALLRAGVDRARILSCGGTGFVERRLTEGRKEYRFVPEKGDPLRLVETPKLLAFADAGWHASREWLEASVDAVYPDFVAQVVEMFDSPHTGDVVVMAGEGWSLHGTQRGGHGSCCRRDVLIPLFFAGPDIPRGASTGPARLVDVMPTIIGLLGKQDRLESVDLDGIDLSLRVKSAQ